MLSICLIFCQFQLGVAYKSAAFKKSVYIKSNHQMFYTTDNAVKKLKSLIIVFDIDTRFDNLSKKANEENSHLAFMCQEGGIPFISHCGNSRKHLNELLYGV